MHNQPFWAIHHSHWFIFLTLQETFGWVAEERCWNFSMRWRQNAWTCWCQTPWDYLCRSTVAWSLRRRAASFVWRTCSVAWIDRSSWTARWESGVLENNLIATPGWRVKCCRIDCTFEDGTLKKNVFWVFKVRICKCVLKVNRPFKVLFWPLWYLNVWHIFHPALNRSLYFDH